MTAVAGFQRYDRPLIPPLPQREMGRSDFGNAGDSGRFLTAAYDPLNYVMRP